MNAQGRPDTPEGMSDDYKPRVYDADEIHKCMHFSMDESRWLAEATEIAMAHHNGEIEHGAMGKKEFLCYAMIEALPRKPQEHSPASIEHAAEMALKAALAYWGVLERHLAG